VIHIHLKGMECITIILSPEKIKSAWNSLQLSLIDKVIFINYLLSMFYNSQLSKCEKRFLTFLHCGLDQKAGDYPEDR